MGLTKPSPIALMVLTDRPCCFFKEQRGSESEYKERGWWFPAQLHAVIIWGAENHGRSGPTSGQWNENLCPQDWDKAF